MTFLFLTNKIILVLFFIHLIRTVLYEVYLWQLKEYRLDRILAFFSTNQGKKFIFHKLNITKCFLLLGYPVLFSLINILFLHLLIIFVYLFEIFIFLYKGLEQIRIPKLTLKAVVIIFFSLIFLVLLFLLIPTNNIFRILLLDRLIFFTVILTTLTINFPFQIIKEIILFFALSKIRQFSNLIVIGITGSYGKTSTKEYLSFILSQKYKVLKTTGSENTDIAIARTILNKLNSNHQVFVVEMGAYKKGEIASICKIIRPQIGIITGINQQHLQLFGSLKNTMKAKFELIENLKVGGKAFFNTSNNYVKKMVDWCKLKRPDLNLYKYYFFSGKSKKEKKSSSIQENELVITKTQVQQNELNFQLSYLKKSYFFKAKLSGKQHIENLTAAIFVALNLGFTLKQLKEIILGVKAPFKTMKEIKISPKVIFIDDSYNSNPDGVLAALSYLKIFSGKKFLILTPLIELGEKAGEIHYLIGKKAASICNQIFVTNSNYFNFLKAGVEISSDNKNKLQIINSVLKKQLIKKAFQTKSVLLFEGKEAGKILTEYKYLKYV